MWTYILRCVHSANSKTLTHTKKKLCCYRHQWEKGKTNEEIHLKGLSEYEQQFTLIRSRVFNLYKVISNSRFLLYWQLQGKWDSNSVLCPTKCTAEWHYIRARGEKVVSAEVFCICTLLCTEVSLKQTRRLHFLAQYKWQSEHGMRQL